MFLFFRNPVDDQFGHFVLGTSLRAGTIWSSNHTRHFISTIFFFKGFFNFYFTLLFGTSKGFMKALKAFIKPSAAPKRTVKIKI